MTGRDSVFKIRYIFFFAAILLAFLAIISYSPLDAALLAGGTEGIPKNWIGRLGAYFSLCVFRLFGIVAYFIPLLALIRAVRLLAPGPGRFSVFAGGALLSLFGTVLIFGLNPEIFSGLCERLGLGRSQLPALALSGGVIGQVLAAPAYPPYHLPEGFLRHFIGSIGTMICGWAFLTGGAAVIYISDWHKFIMEHLTFPEESPRKAPGRSRKTEEEFEEDELFDDEEEEELAQKAPSNPRLRLASLLKDVEEKSEKESLAEEDDDEKQEFDDTLFGDIKDKDLPPKRTAAEASPELGSTVEKTITEKGERLRAKVQNDYTLPPVSMLSQGEDATGESPEAIKNATLQIQRSLDSFNIAGEVVGYTSGPRITQYEISLADGVPVKKVENIKDDIKMNLSALSIRVQAPIPGRNVVGVEIPNSRSEAVFMRSVMESDEWKNTKCSIPIVLGKNVAGKPIIIDLAKAPHLLIAGSTGSGKSVCMNTLIMSLLFKFSPDDLRLIMVDPKVVEFEDYRQLPHLMTPVINDAKKVPIALRWAVTEMENRYKILAKAGVKKLAEFNALSKNGEPVSGADGEMVTDKFGVPVTHMPILTVIIDELAELRMQDSWKDSETYIGRIAQLGRAAGVHIVVATQRPSTNIITGVIKANLPTRIAFRVLQLVDSRVILDQPGAENLLGYGDMLALLPGAFELERIQGALVDDKDIKSIVKFVSDQRPQNFDSSVIAEAETDELGEGECDRPGKNGSMDDDDIFDEMDKAEIAPLIRKYMQPGDSEIFRRALEVVILDQKASTSYIQRRLGIGYNRAAELIDTMEERGIVGPPSGSGNKREILVFDGIEING